MKKRIYLSVSIIVVMAFAAVVTLKVWSPKPTARELLLDENIEALSDGETEKKEQDCYKKKEQDCYNTITSKKGSQVRYCPTCTFIPGTAPLFVPVNTCLGSE